MTKPSRSEILTLNERLKAVASMFFNLATALIAATAARVAIKETFDVSALVWTFGVAALIFIRWKALHLLEPET